MDSFYQKLTDILTKESVRQGENMGRHTTFRAGGPAAYYTEPGTVEELKQVQALCQREQMPYYFIGNGSNLLVSDSGYDGVIIAMGKAWSGIEAEGETLRVGSGALLSAVAKAALKLSLTGFEFAAGIPGTVGGAVVMNAGAYGSEMKDVLVSATVLTPEGEVKVMPASELSLSYRTSCIPRMGGLVLSAEYKLKPGDTAAIQAAMEDLALKRRTKQPLEYPSAGSTFKRPEGYFAGKLIQDAGLGGYRVGGAQVSEKHCGFVINRDHATAYDIWKLCKDVQEKVLQESGIKLELEVKLLGSF